MTRRLLAASTAMLLVALLIPSVALANRPAIAMGAAMLGHGETQTLTDFQAATGRWPAMWMIWSDWGDEDTKRFPTAETHPVLPTLLENNIALVMTWQPIVTGNPNDPRFRYKKIADGDHDPYIRQWARDAKAYGGRVLVRFAHEMTGIWFRWSIGYTGTAKEFKDAWKRVVNIFRQEEATNVKFIWSVAQPCKRCTPYADAYPGKKFVDYVGFSGFSWGPPKPWKPMQNVFFTAMSKMSTVAGAKPVIFTETAAGVGPTPTSRKTWIASGYRDVYTRWPKVRGIIYFNVPTICYPNGNCHPDWRLRSGDKSLGAYKALLKETRFQGFIP